MNKRTPFIKLVFDIFRVSLTVVGIIEVLKYLQAL